LLKIFYENMTFQNYENFSSKVSLPDFRNIDFDKDGLIAACINTTFSIDLYKFKLSDEGEFTL
jgi:hypothetical protein